MNNKIWKQKIYSNKDYKYMKKKKRNKVTQKNSQKLISKKHQ